MEPNQEKESMNVVELASSDDGEDGSGVTRRKSRSSEAHIRPESVPVPSPTGRTQGSESRSFWKAGAYDVGPVKFGSTQGVLEQARVHPKFLHSNATSHKWAFGAIAELLDNAVDEIPGGATFVKVDKLYNKENAPALLFQDDGGGMSPESIRHCMSLGYSKKKSNTTIGQYGNGFKTSTMRLGADVIVFSRTTLESRTTQSIGLLSYTFLRKTGQDDVIVPMVDFELLDYQHAEPIICGSLDDWSNNLNIILQWSPFSSKEELMQQFDDIGPHGTKIIVYNLWFNEDGLLELDFDNDEEDIRLRDEVNREKLSKKDRSIESHISYRIRFSLRAYASVLYLRQFTNFQIILRGKPVQQYHIADELKFSEVVTYKPQLGKFSKEVYAKTTIGYVKEAPHLPVSGINVYHKNRLIRPFWKLTNNGNSVGNGVVGVLEANFIEPAHDKQDFERSTLFIRLETRLKQMIYDYWKTHCHLIGIASPFPDIRTMQKQRLTDQPATEFAAANIQREPRIDQPVIGLSANMQKEMHLDQHAVGLSANMEKGMHLDQPVIGPSADVLKGMHLNQPVIGLAANSTSNIQNDVLHPIIGLAADGRMQVNAENTWNSVSGNEGHGSSKGGSSTDCSISATVDQICEENVQLFMRCEEHRQKQIDMKKKIEEMEREFEDKKRKCSELASRIESQRRQMRQQSEKA